MKEYNYSLINFDKCQVSTPLDIIEYVWKRVHEYRSFFDSVLDFGAGDARFSKFGNYNRYIGVEIDKEQIADVSELAENVKMINECAFACNLGEVDLCIGNPPYMRHHSIDKEWQRINGKHLSKQLEMTFDHRSNLYLYFLALSLLSTKEDGIVALVVPFEWVSRPSAKPIREFIKRNGWDVDVYRFVDDIFKHERVLTTASLSIINKSSTSGNWNYYKIDSNFNTIETISPAGSDEQVLNYTRRVNDIYAQRGLSPGTQKVFCLTEEERLFHGLIPNRDVVPCVTSMKCVDRDLHELNTKVFKEHYIHAGARCWLIKPNNSVSEALKCYLDSIPFEKRNTWTCNNREIWWQYPFPKSPDIIYSSGFTYFGPKFMLNTINAVVVGSIHGIFNKTVNNNIEILYNLKNYNFESKIVGHSGVLKKVEVNQMNTVLHQICVIQD